MYVDSNVITFSPQIFAVPFKNIYPPGVTLNGLAHCSLCLAARRHHTPDLSSLKPESYTILFKGVSSDYSCSPERKLRRNSVLFSHFNITAVIPLVFLFWISF